MSLVSTVTPDERAWLIRANRWIYRLARHWLLALNVALGVCAGLPWLAPVFMKLGWAVPGRAIYLLYSTQCHQLPQRSFFLFGPRLMHPLAEIQAAWQVTTNLLLLRQFVGSAELGWKVAWSDRMVSMYTGIFLFGLLYALVRRQIRPLPWQGFVLLALPMVVDGGTHLVSDLAGVGLGFRDSNAWLAAVTGHALPATFYAGDALGSFNSWMRLITGSLFALGAVWAIYPLLEGVFADLAGQIETGFRHAGWMLQASAFEARAVDSRS